MSAVATPQQAPERAERPTIARVLVDSPLPQLDRLFDYRIPPEFLSDVRPGIRVRVPLRSAGRIADGYVIELATSVDYVGTLSDIESLVSTAAVLTPQVWTLARKAADRAAGSAIDVVRVAVPSRQVRVEKAWLAAQNAAGDAAVATDPIDTVSGSVAMMPPLAGYPVGLIESAITEHRRLAIDAIPLVTQIASGVWVGSWAVTMAAAAAVSVRAGASAILAVPDYRDQEQLEAALAAVLPPDRIARLDAHQSNPDRYRAFLRCLGGRALAIVGNRSVIYAPAERLGLIAIWDDGDPLHSEPLAPYVHARDAALLRQEQQECALLFLGHSRSTEVERLVELGWVASVSPAPAVLPRVIPTAQQAAGDRLAAQARIPSSA
jgi:primosomal protein N' (replication factor Y)